MQIQGMSPMNFISSAQWDNEDHYLSDFTQKYTLPQVVKITKGHYMGLGVPSLSNPSLSQMVLLAQVTKRIKIAAQCVKFKDGNRVVPVGTKIAIPDNFEGWFEILSEDGRAVRCIENVGELLRRFPEMCLVRENIKAHLAKIDNTDIISDKTRTVSSGETLVLVSEVHVTPVRSRSSGRYLRCFTAKGETVFLSADQKGKFSPIAGEDSISGVHTIKNLLSKRFPLMVRLVHGKPPAGLKSGSQFTMEMRLYSLFEEESIMALPLSRITHLVALPPSAPMKVQAPMNSEILMKFKIFDVLVEKCKSLVQDASNKIQIFDISMSKELRKENSQAKKEKKKLPWETKIKRSTSDPNSKHGDKGAKAQKQVAKNDPENRSNVAEHSYDEIDAIYNYIRGTGPLPQTVINPDNRGSPIRGSTVSSSQFNSGSTPSFDIHHKPIPPPIETIPIRQMMREESQMLPLDNFNFNQSFYDFENIEGHIYEQVGPQNYISKTTPENSKGIHAKLFISHSGNHGVRKFLMQSPAQCRIHQKSRLLKSAPALKDIPIQSQRTIRSKSLVTSPIFNIRYKSLINLAMDVDSSHSSENRNAMFAGGDNRWNRLQRPKSLTDIFGAVDHLCKYRDADDIAHDIENRRYLFSHENVNGRLFSGHPSRHIGTLYL